jgi:hypothetical protein
MGVEYNPMRFVGTTNMEDLHKLPEEVEAALEDDQGLSEGLLKKYPEFKGLRFISRYGEKPVAFGFVLQEFEMDGMPVEDATNYSHINALSNYGIIVKVYNYVETY